MGAEDEDDLMSNLTASKVSRKKQPLVFTSGFEKKNRAFESPLCKKMSWYQMMLLC